MSETENLLVTPFRSDNYRVSEYGLFGALMAYNGPLGPAGSYKGPTPGAADISSSTSAVNNGTNFSTLTVTDYTKLEMCGFEMVGSSIIGSTRPGEHSLFTNYLRGELSGNYSVLGGITNTTISLPAQGSSQVSWWSGLYKTFTFSGEWSRQVFIKFGGFDYFSTDSREDRETNSVLRVLSKLILGATPPCYSLHRGARTVSSRGSGKYAGTNLAYSESGCLGRPFNIYTHRSY